MLIETQDLSRQLKVKWMREIGERIRTQDNRMTSDPIFIVEERSGRGWKFVTACLTEQGCKDFISADGHNLNKPRIYVKSGYRNEEWIGLREFMKQA